MGCLGRLITIGAILTQIVASGAALLVLEMAGVLGGAAIIGTDDAMILFILMALNLLATLVLGFKLWRSGSDRKRMRRQLASYQDIQPLEQRQ